MNTVAGPENRVWMASAARSDHALGGSVNHQGCRHRAGPQRQRWHPASAVSDWIEWLQMRGADDGLDAAKDGQRCPQAGVSAASHQCERQPQEHGHGRPNGGPCWQAASTEGHGRWRSAAGL